MSAKDGGSGGVGNGDKNHPMSGKCVIYVQGENIDAKSIVCVWVSVVLHFWSAKNE